MIEINLTGVEAVKYVDLKRTLELRELEIAKLNKVIADLNQDDTKVKLASPVSSQVQKAVELLNDLKESAVDVVVSKEPSFIKKSFTNLFCKPDVIEQPEQEECAIIYDADVPLNIFGKPYVMGKWTESNVNMIKARLELPYANKDRRLDIIALGLNRPIKAVRSKLTSLGISVKNGICYIKEK